MVQLFNDQQQLCESLVAGKQLPDVQMIDRWAYYWRKGVVILAEGLEAGGRHHAHIQVSPA